MHLDNVALEGDILERITYTIPPSRMDTTSFFTPKCQRSTSSLGGGGGGVTTTDPAGKDDHRSLAYSRSKRMQDQKLEWNVNSSKESTKVNVATFSPVKSLNRLVSLLQICAVSFFALNQDLTLKLVYSFTWLVFILITIAIETPCLFNCYVDPKALTQAPLTPDFLAVLADAITLIHAIVAGVTALRIGGDLRRFGYFFTLVTSTSPASPHRSSPLASKIYWSLRVYILFLTLVAIAAFECFILVQLNPRRILRPYTPDKLKLSEAREGKDPYLWEYTPVIDVGQDMFMYSSLLFRGLLVIHVRSLEVITIHLSSILKSANFLDISSTRDTREDTMDDENDNDENANDQRKMSMYLYNVLNRIVFKSLLFNLFSILTSIAMVTRAMTTIYIIPSVCLYDLVKLIEAIFFIICLLSSCSQMHLQLTLLNSKLKASFPTGSQMGALLLLVIAYAIFICMIVENTQNTVIHTAYYDNETRDWFSELKGIPPDIKEKFKNEFEKKAKGEAGVYLTPEYFDKKIEQVWDERERQQIAEFFLSG